MARHRQGQRRVRTIWLRRKKRNCDKSWRQRHCGYHGTPEHVFRPKQTTPHRSAAMQPSCAPIARYLLVVHGGKPTGVGAGPSRRAAWLPAIGDVHRPGAEGRPWILCHERGRPRVLRHKRRWSWILRHRRGRSWVGHHERGQRRSWVGCHELRPIAAGGRSWVGHHERGLPWIGRHELRTVAA